MISRKNTEKVNVYLQLLKVKYLAIHGLDADPLQGGALNETTG